MLPCNIENQLKKQPHPIRCKPGTATPFLPLKKHSPKRDPRQHCIKTGANRLKPCPQQLIAAGRLMKVSLTAQPLAAAGTFCRENKGQGAPWPRSDPAQPFPICRTVTGRGRPPGPGLKRPPAPPRRNTPGDISTGSSPRSVSELDTGAGSAIGHKSALDTQEV